MNTKTIDKVHFFLNGISSRLEDVNNLDLIHVTFKAGLKVFKLEGNTKENSLFYNYLGENFESNFEKMVSHILLECVKYDDLILEIVLDNETLVIDANNKNVKYFTKENTKKDNASKSNTLLNRNYYIKYSEASSLLKEIGIMSDDFKIKNDKIRKYNQIDYYIEQLEPIINSLPKNRQIRIVDCGCGKSYLTFALNFYLTKVKNMDSHFIGIDLSPSVIESSKKTAKNLGYSNMEFLNIDLSDYKDKSPIDILISLHACDTATDYALYFGIKNKSRNIISVPCCHRELSRTLSIDGFKGITKYSTLKNRLSDVLTDGSRGIILESFGYNVTIHEYISPLESPKNLMIRATKSNDSTKLNRKKIEEYENFMKITNTFPKIYSLLLEDKLI